MNDSKNFIKEKNINDKSKLSTVNSSKKNTNDIKINSSNSKEDKIVSELVKYFLEIKNKNKRDSVFNMIKIIAKSDDNI